LWRPRAQLVISAKVGCGYVITVFACLSLSVNRLSQKVVKEFLPIFWRGGMCSWSDFGDDPEYDADTEIFGKEFLYH